jgi:hypothetical protein
VSLTLSLGSRDPAARLLTLSEGSSCELTGTDELSRGYTLRNWQGGIISGASYAFRTLGVPFQPLYLRELRGQLGCEDISALSFAAALAVARLLDQPDPPLDLNGWKVEAEVRRRAASGNGPSESHAAVPASAEPEQAPAE